jgi:hypothetical protein
VFGGRREINTADFAASVGKFFADCGLTDEGLAELAHAIVAASPAHVVNPTGYAVTAVRNAVREGDLRWITLGYEIAGRRLDLAGNDF